MATAEAHLEAAGLDEAIGTVENLYRAVTGKNPPSAEETYSPIPVERDPAKFVEEQFDRLLSILNPASPAPAVAWTPMVKIWESDGEYLVCMDVPGVTRKDVEVTLQAGLLTVKGHRPSPFSADHQMRTCEGMLGPFVRKVLLPANVRASDPSASLKDGVLEIRIAKEAPSSVGPRSILVN